MRSGQSNGFLCDIFRCPLSRVTAPVSDMTVEALGEAIGVREEDRAPRGWFTRLVRRYFQRALEKAKAREAAASSAADARPVTERARSAIRRACVKSAFTGALTGGISTGATVLTAQSEGALGFVAIPAAGLAIGGEMMLRAV